MEAKDFIIGGWYYHKEKNMDGSPRICAEKVDLDIFKCILDYTNEYFEAKDYYPIPISEDILEKNGWTLLANFGGEDYWSENGEFHLPYNKGQYRIIIHGIVIKITYVHELQRVLRCCGLNDIADNFKI